MTPTSADDIRSTTPPDHWLVSGYFTPDYRHWAEALAESLRHVAAPFHLLAREKAAGGWEANTMRKPFLVKEAMALYPSKTVLFLDVDCTVKGKLDGLAALDCDFGAYFGAKLRRRRMRDRLKFGVRSGTLLLHPTATSARLVDAWIAAAQECGRFDVDQTALMLALTRVPDLRVTFLDVKWCATEGDRVDNPVVRHSAASRTAFKASRIFSRQ